MRRCGRDGWNVFAGVHQVAYFGELLAELAAGVQLGKILGAEALAQADGDGERIAQGKHRGGGGSGRKIQPAGLALDRAIERNIAGCGEGRLQIAAEADERVAFALEGGEEAQDLFGLAAGREGNDYVARHQHAQIAVYCLGWMQKQGRASRWS